jgi:hypothetical protein
MSKLVDSKPFRQNLTDLKSKNEAVYALTGRFKPGAGVSIPFY